MSSDTGLTKEFLEMALRRPILKFEASLGSSLGDGYTCAMYKATVWPKEAPNKNATPLHVVVKCFPQNEARQQVLDEGNLMEMEVRYYDTIIPALTKFQEEYGLSEKFRLPFAPLLYGKYLSQEEREALGRPLKPVDNCVMMPDMREDSNGGYRIRDRFLGFDFDHQKLVVEGQATLHATSWAYKVKKGLKSLKEHFPILDASVAEIWKQFMPTTRANIQVLESHFGNRPEIQRALAHVKEVFPSVYGIYTGFDGGQEERGHTPESLLRIPGEISENEEPWEVLLHGDCWSNNLLFRYDPRTGKPVETVFIDLQMTRETEPFPDLSYSLYVNPEPELRRKHLPSLLRFYFDRFTQVCDSFSVPYLPGWSWPEFQRRFRRASVFGGTLSCMLPLILKHPDELVNLDDNIGMNNDGTASTTGGKGESNSAMNQFTDFFLEQAKCTRLHPSVLPRLTDVFEDLIQDGVF